jgi:hypothetical protein
MGPRLFLEKALSFLFKEINALKKQLKPAEAKNPKRGRLNPSSPMRLI